MERPLKLLQSEPGVVNVGLKCFADVLDSLGTRCTHVEWRPPAHGDPYLGRLLAALDVHYDRIAAANDEAAARVVGAQPVWIDVGPALDMIPGFDKNLILHAGPPVTWDKMCGPMRGAVIGALIFEGLARDAESALVMAGSGEIRFAPCHHYAAVGPMAGVVSASMPVVVVENRAFGNRAFSPFNSEGGRRTAISFGLYGPEAQEMLGWQRDVLAPAVRNVLRDGGGIDLKSITARALHMGDECHNRHVAATSLLARELMPSLARVGTTARHIAEIGSLLLRNDWFFLNLSMAACKASLDPAAGIPWSTMVTAMARNGVEVGIRVSALGDTWFTAPAPAVEGLYFAGFSEGDANPDLGDSAITETSGIGAFAMAAAPGMTMLVGGSVASALGYTREMAEITCRANPSYTIPYLDFAGTPTGIDALKVIETGITPIIDTGIAHREPGVGMVGAGMVRMPMKCFVDAVRAFAASVGCAPDDRR